MDAKAIVGFAIERELLLRKVQTLLETHKSDATNAEAAILERLRVHELAQPAGELTVEQAWQPYDHDTCPRECWLWLSFPRDDPPEGGLYWLENKDSFWYPDRPTHYMLATIPTPPVEQKDQE